VVPVQRPGYLRAKRALDIVLASAGLVVLFPLLLLVSVLVFASDGAPIFFRHERVGKNRRTIRIYKFRTMRKGAMEALEADHALKEQFEKNYKLKQDPRITPFGRLLRDTSIDELPQLVNVLKGEMSLVGPRPIVVPELPRYGDYQEVYLSLIPGCAGLWQCSGRSDTTYEERVRLDVEYARNASIAFDLAIMARTFVALLRRRGAR